MITSIQISKKKGITFTAWESRIWVGILDSPSLIMGVTIDVSELQRCTSYSQLKTDNYVYGGYYQDGIKVYVKLRFETETVAFQSAQDWMFKNKIVVTTFGLTGSDFYVNDGIAYKTGLLSKYSINVNSDDNNYDQVKFSGISISLIWDKIKELGDVVGNYLYLLVDDTIIEKQYIENTVRRWDVLKVYTKDLRASLKQAVLDQKFLPNEFTTDLGGGPINAVDQDVLKTDKSDAVGYCVGVPAVCMNGDQKTGEPNKDWRYYRASYGTINVDSDGDANGVEVKMDSGWKKIPSGGTGWQLVDYTETYPNGLTITTKLIKIPTEVVHIPKPGMIEPDYACTPREVRVTGTFHYERANITRPIEIIKYLFERYTYIPWEASIVNITEMTNELAPLNDAPIGIYFGEQTDLFEAIGKIQNGSIMGFKFTSYLGLFTARLHNPNRAISRTIKQHTIINLFDLELNNMGSSYVSDGYVQYAKVWSEQDVYAEVRDQETRKSILQQRNLDKTGGVETLLKNKEDAETRFNNFMNTSKNITPRISGIKLNGPQYITFREYEIVTIDFGDLTPIRTWYILNAQFDPETNDCTIDVMAKL
ncbi:hypothetical protein FACS1894141_0470 [Spirochaetia bacterium]|nr:hypothetical protein FACS1894141_0470 [Spirochaetia bacterium]